MKKKYKYNWFLHQFLKLLWFLVRMLPLIIILIINWKAYTKTKQTTVGLTLSGGLYMVLLIIEMLKKMPAKVNLTLFDLFLCVIIYAVKPIINDLLLFMAAITLSRILAWLFVDKRLAYMEELKKANLTADVTVYKWKTLKTR